MGNRLCSFGKLFHLRVEFQRDSELFYFQGLYGVYTRTSSYIDWIRENINPKGLNAGQLHTTVSTTTVRPTTAAPTTRPGEKKISEDCGKNDLTLWLSQTQRQVLRKNLR